jgi:serine/threonine protein kinase
MEYTKVKDIGIGNFGKVYIAKDESGEMYVIKTIEFNENKSSAILNELDALSVIKSKCKGVFICMDKFEIIANDTIDDSLDDSLDDLTEKTHIVYIVMDYIKDSYTLSTYLDTHDIPLKTHLHIMKQLTVGLQMLHNIGVVHKDIKLDNILYVPSDESIRYLDFGFACVEISEFRKYIDAGVIPSENGRAIKREEKCMLANSGTPNYISYELKTKKMTTYEAVKATDIWALGVLFYIMVTGKSLYQKDGEKLTVSILYKELVNLTETIDVYSRANQFVNKNIAEILDNIIKPMIELDWTERTSLQDTIDRIDREITKLDERTPELLFAEMNVKMKNRINLLGDSIQTGNDAYFLRETDNHSRLIEWDKRKSEVEQCATELAVKIHSKMHGKWGPEVEAAVIQAVVKFSIDSPVYEEDIQAMFPNHNLDMVMVGSLESTIMNIVNWIPCASYDVRQGDSVQHDTRYVSVGKFKMKKSLISGKVDRKHKRGPGFIKQDKERRRLWKVLDGIGAVTGCLTSPTEWRHPKQKDNTFCDLRKTVVWEMREFKSATEDMFESKWKRVAVLIDTMALAQNKYLKSDDIDEDRLKCILKLTKNVNVLVANVYGRANAEEAHRALKWIRNNNRCLIGPPETKMEKIPDKIP